MPTVPAPERVRRPNRRLRHRKNIERMTPAQLEVLRDAFAKFKAVTDDRGFGHWAGIHGLPLPTHCQHGSRIFLPWHRAYLYFFELALRDRGPDASLPWWDWTTPGTHRSGLPNAYALARVGGRANPLARAPVPPAARQGGQPVRTSRAPRSPALLPAPQAVERLLKLDDFDDFSTQLENLHGAVHVWVGGTMSMIPWAAYDPIFWGHHTMIDRLWRIWQLRHPGIGPDRTLLDRALPPFDMTVRQTLEVADLGYDYADATSHSPGNR